MKTEVQHPKDVDKNDSKCCKFPKLCENCERNMWLFYLEEENSQRLSFSG